jgi:hypothetical protein
MKTWRNDELLADASLFLLVLFRSFLLFPRRLRLFGLFVRWHGVGCLLDYSNPAAVAWWHSQMDVAFATGVDGWKTDGTDAFLMTTIEPRTSSGAPYSYRQYADAYYGETN